MCVRELLTLENECSLNRVVVFEVNVLTQRRIVHLELRRLGHVCGCAGNGRKYGIVERCHLAVRTAERLHLTVSDSPYAKGSLTFLDLERNGRPLHSDNLTDQLHQVCDRTALLAGINAQERLFLFLCSPLIYVDDSAPVTFQDVSRDVYSKSQSEARHIYTIDFPFFEMMRQRGIASPVIRVNTDPARTEHLTVADFEKTSFEFVGHIYSLLLYQLH